MGIGVKQPQSVQDAISSVTEASICYRLDVSRTKDNNIKVKFPVQAQIRLRLALLVIVGPLKVHIEFLARRLHMLQAKSI